MAEAKEKAPKATAPKTYKCKSTNPYLYVLTKYGQAQFIDGVFETTNKELYHALLAYDAILAV